MQNEGTFLARRSIMNTSAHPLSAIHDFGLIAGSCATENHEPRQVREEATVVTLSVCRRVPGYHLF